MVSRASKGCRQTRARTAGDTGEVTAPGMRFESRILRVYGLI